MTNQIPDAELMLIVAEPVPVQVVGSVVVTVICGRVFTTRAMEAGAELQPFSVRLTK